MTFQDDHKVMQFLMIKPAPQTILREILFTEKEESLNHISTEKLNQERTDERKISEDIHSI